MMWKHANVGELHEELDRARESGASVASFVVYFRLRGSRFLGTNAIPYRTQIRAQLLEERTKCQKSIE